MHASFVLSLLLNTALSRQTPCPLPTRSLQGFNRQGEIRLFLIEVRPLSSLRGAPPGYVMRIEPCPPSHHVSATPGMHKAIAPFRPSNGGGMRASAASPPVWPPRLASRLPQSGEAGSGVCGGGSESGSGTAASLMLQLHQRAHPHLAYQHTVLAPAVTGMAALPLTCPPTEVAGTRSARQLAALFSTARGRAVVKEKVQPPPPPPPSRTLPPPPPPPPSSPRLPPPHRSSGGGASAPLTGSSARVDDDEQVPAFDEALLEQVFDDDEAESM